MKNKAIVSFNTVVVFQWKEESMVRVWQGVGHVF